MSSALSKSTGRINNENTDKTFVDILRYQAQRIPQQPAVVHLQTVLTFAQLDAMSDVIAAELIKNGVKLGDHVGICPSRTEIIPLCIFGVFKAGAAYVPLDPNYPPKRLSYMLKDADIRVVLSETNFFDRFNDFTGKILDARQLSQQSDSKSVSKSVSFPTITPNDAAAIIYTSGSTGTPKGAELCHRYFTSVATYYKNLYDIKQTDAMSAYAGFPFAANVIEYYPPILAGATLHFLDDSIRLDPRAVNRYFEDNNISIAFLPTAFGCRFITQIKNNSLRLLTMAGERLIPIESSQSSFKIFNAYGTTETSYISTMQILPGKQNISVGVANDNVEIYIVNEKNEIVPVGESGELCVAGRQVGFGYINLPEKTAQVFVKNPFNNSPDYERMYHTGDVARMNENGQIEIRGRLDHQVKIRGFRVELGEIDTAALQFPNIAESVTVTVPSPDGENRLVTYISSPNKIESKKLQHFIGEVLPSYMIPATIIQIDKLPRNFSGKIDRAALPPVEISTVVEADDLPKTEAEKNLARVVAKILKTPIESVGVNSDLFEFGLDSLLVFDFILEIQKQFYIDLTPEQITQNPTISKLVTIMPAENAENAETEEDTNSFYPLTYHQRSLLDGYFNDPNNIKDNVSLKYEFSEKTDIEKLASAVKTAISAHPLLTARLVKNGDNYAWQRNNNATITIETVNQINDEELAQEEKTFICPFNLMSGGLLFRGKIYKTLSSVVMLFDIHHSIMDGFSQKILLEDIAAAYRGEKVASERQPTALTAGLKEQEQLVSSDVDDKCNELVRRIKSCGDLTKLPEQKQLDKPAGSAKFYHGKLLSEESINAFCKANNVSSNGVYMSSFVKAVSSHCGIPDVLFSFIIIGRDKVNSRAVGAFIKTIPIVVTYDKNKSAVENCRAAESAIKLSTQCANVMLIKYRKAQKPEWGKLPIFAKPLLYIFHGNLEDNDLNPVIEDKKLNRSFIVRSDAGENSIPSIPLEFIAQQSQGSYNHLCKYNDALFDEKFVARFVNEIETNIEQLTIR